MAVALEAISKFIHHFTDDWAHPADASHHVVTILDVLEMRRPQAEVIA